MNAFLTEKFVFFRTWHREAERARIRLSDTFILISLIPEKTFGDDGIDVIPARFKLESII